MGAALLQKLLIVSLGMLLAPRVINKLDGWTGLLP